MVSGHIESPSVQQKHPFKGLGRECKPGLDGAWLNCGRQHRASGYIRKERWSVAKSFRVSADKQGHRKIRTQHLDTDVVIWEH